MSLENARTRASIARQGFDVIRATLRSPREAYHARAAILTYADCLAAYSDVVTAHSDAVVAQEAATYPSVYDDAYKAPSVEVTTHYGLTAIFFAALGWASGLLCGLGVL